MKANFKPKLSDKVFGKIFEEIVDALLTKYENSTEKETMSFEEYCRALKDLSYNQRKNIKEKE